MQTVQVKDKILHTIIKYGWKAPGSSSQMSGDRPEDISHIFVLKDKFHTHFGRDASVWSGVYHGATRTGHTVHGVLKATILKWFAIPFSNGPHSVRSLHHYLSILGGTHTAWLSFIELDKAVVHVIRLASCL